MKSFDRRRFLKCSLASSASLALLPAWGAEGKRTKKAAPRAASANGDIGFAVVGFGGRGENHITGLREVPGTRLVALCDVDSAILGKELAKCEAAGEKVRGYADVRKLLEDKEVDVVSFATPNHWHALGSIWAIQAGKDVYVEKPVSHNVWEGRQIVLAARKYGRVVQAGTQARSGRGIREAIQWLREGNLGKILRARGLCYKRRPSIGKVTGPQPIPAGVDYDLWCGPAPKEPLMRKRLHYDWHWVWPTGNGDLGNQGIHQMDLARWLLGETALSPRVLSIGGRLGYVDDGTTPNTQIVFHDYPAAPLIFEVRGLPSREGASEMDRYRGGSIAAFLDCEGGYLAITNYSGANAFDLDHKLIKAFEGGMSHFGNFIAAVRSRKVEHLNADILEGHLSSALCHTGNISHRLGKKQGPEQIREAIKENKDLEEAFLRMEQHLVANGVDLTKNPATLGMALRMDPATERFIGNHEANQLLAREYREPFVVPAIV
jgi:predicted dehydrogenase